MNEELIDLSCKEAARLMTKRQDADLTAIEQESLKSHLYECLGCRRFDTQLEFLRRLARKYGQSGAPGPQDPV